MDNSTQLPHNNRILIETDDLILTLNLDQIYFVQLVTQQKIQISGHNFNYSLPINNDDNIVSKIQNSGFICLNKSFYINPLQISEFNIKKLELKFTNGAKILISSNSSKKLLRYFVENTSSET
jgi:hypothetical protein